MLKGLLGPIPKGSGDACLDPAYLSRRNCNLIARKGRSPIIKPKRNITIRKHGSQAWRDMIALWLEDKASFLKRYHQRSRAESVYSALKRCHGNYLSSHKRRAQRRELHLKTLAYNIGIANLTSVREENGLTFHSRSAFITIMGSPHQAQSQLASPRGPGDVARVNITWLPYLIMRNPCIY